MQERYLNSHQARRRLPTAYEDLLGDSIERAFAAGICELSALVAHLNRTGPNYPAGGEWTEQGYQAELARLAAEC
ncbi:MAG: recombinase-like helix-turn-helix domain-containing protein [Pseudomonadota bacterium]